MPICVSFLTNTMPIIWGGGGSLIFANGKYWAPFRQYLSRYFNFCLCKCFLNFLWAPSRRRLPLLWANNRYTMKYKYEIKTYKIFKSSTVSIQCSGQARWSQWSLMATACPCSPALRWPLFSEGWSAVSSWWRWLSPSTADWSYWPSLLQPSWIGF